MKNTHKPKKGLCRKMYFARNLLDPEKVKHVSTRDGFGMGLLEAGKQDKKVMALTADLTDSTRTGAFKKAFPDRFVQVGICEQAMASIASGLALSGKTPFISSFAAFSPGRNWEQIRTCIALQNTNVKIAGSHAGLSAGKDGGTHQMLEDIALMRAMPNMRVLSPCDSIQTRKAVEYAAKTKGPFYIRFSRIASPVITTEKTPFKFGRAEIFRCGTDLTIAATGPLVYEALLAAQALSEDHGIEARVVCFHTIKPIDKSMIVKCAKETGAFVTVEEAQVNGGFAGAICETLALTTPVPVERIGMQDKFGESGTARELQEAFGLTAPFIALAADRVLQRKLSKRVSAKPAHITAAEELYKKKSKG